MTPALAIGDRLAIKRLFARYAWALATRSFDSLGSVFTAEARIESEGEERDLAGFIEQLRDGVQIPGRQDWINQSQVRGDAARCTVRSFGMTTSRFPSGATAVAWLGYYDDVLVTVDDEWRISTRVIRPWSGEVLEGFPSYLPIPHDAPRP